MDEQAWESLEEEVLNLLESYGLDQLEDVDRRITAFIDKLRDDFEESLEDSDSDPDW